jgi:hypothetical protein
MVVSWPTDVLRPSASLWGPLAQRIAECQLSEFVPAQLLCGEVLYWAGDSVALAVGLHRVHRVVVGRPRLKVVQVHAPRLLIPITCVCAELGKFSGVKVFGKVKTKPLLTLAP